MSSGVWTGRLLLVKSLISFSVQPSPDNDPAGALFLAAGFPPLGGAEAPTPTRFIVTGYSWTMGLGIVVLTSGSLYLSTLCSSGVRAAVMALPMYVGTVAFMQLMSAIAWKIARSELVVRATSALDVDRNSLRTIHVALDTIFLCGGILLAVLLIYFGYRNFRSGERNVRRVIVQLLCIASVIADLGYPARRRAPLRQVP